MAKSKKGKKGKAIQREEEAPSPPPETCSTSDGEDSVYDSDVPDYASDEYNEYIGANEDEEEEEEDEENSSEDDTDEEDEDDFEDEGSSDEEDELMEKQLAEEEDGSLAEGFEDIAAAYEKIPRKWQKKRTARGNARHSKSTESTDKDEKKKKSVQTKTDTDATKLPNNQSTALWMHTDDLSSDDEDDDGTGNRIGRVPLHWYDEHDHIGYDAHGQKVQKSSSEQEGDLLDRALQQASGENRWTVHDALNDRLVTLTPRQVDLIRRVQAGAYAHPEHDGNPDYIDYVSGVDKEISGLTSNRTPPKSRFQPSQFERVKVQQYLDRLAAGKITMDNLLGKEQSQKQKQDEENKKLFLLWKGDEQDELNIGKGPQHLPAPKLPPPGHVESYRPPEEYLPTEEEIQKWQELDPPERPHGLFVPRRFDNLRSVGAYPHSVRERFERCLDLYLCPRRMKRRLNIDPESLVPQLPRAQDLRPFPTVKCLEYKTPASEKKKPMIRCLSPSPNGQFMVSGATDGFVRLWEVETERLLQSWNVSRLVRLYNNKKNDQENETSPDEQEEVAAPTPVVSLEWNPNKLHHCVLASCGNCAIIISTGTGNADASVMTEALLSTARNDGIQVSNARAAKVVTWKAIATEGQVVADKDDGNKKNGDGGNEKEEENDDDALGTTVFNAKNKIGPVAVLVMTRDVTCVRWHRKGDYFVTVSPKAGAAAVLIHQLSKGNSQQPFSKKTTEIQLACFHPNKPFLFVASTQHIRIYHLVKQNMVKRLVTGCRWIASMDVHSSGDHVIVGSLDRRMIWFDLDLSHTPYKTLKYHKRALRSVGYHGRYPLMASASDDGTVHVFHSMVYSDLVRNPLLVPVKILRGHALVDNEENKGFGVLAMAFHPTQPWLFTGGADGRIFLYQDV